MIIFEYLKRNKIICLLTLLILFGFFLKVISQEKDSLKGEINWRKTNEYKKFQNIIWERIYNENLQELETISENKEKLDFQEKLNLSRPNDRKRLYLRTFIPSNNYLNEGYFSHELNQISSFSGGDAKGTGNQNYSYQLDYGLTNNSLISGIIAEADDPHYNKIFNEDNLNNFWRNYALVFNKKFFRNSKNDFDISLNSSLEYWDISTFYKKTDNTISYGTDQKIISSIGLGIAKKVKNLNLLFAPRISFLPTEFGSENKKNNFYGTNYSLGFGLNLNFLDDAQLYGTYTFLLGESKNSYDSELNFSKNYIYSYGINWNPNAIIGLDLGISNSFGATPASGLLTIPSGNVPLYTFKLTLRPDYRDTLLKLSSKENNYILHSGLTVNNALIPVRNSNKFWLSYDSSKSIYAFYGYSISNVFQIEFANLANFNNVDINYNQTNNLLKEKFFSKGNLNNRFGGTLNIFSPNKGDLYWLSIRSTIGRDQKSVQGYLFSELITTIPVMKKLYVNINPKYAWSSIKSTGGIGLSLNYQFNNKFSIIPEMNLNFRDNNDNNNSLSIRYFINEKKSLDFYYTNALGIQDMSQLVRSKENKFGIKYNLYF